MQPEQGQQLRGQGFRIQGSYWVGIYSWCRLSSLRHGGKSDPPGWLKSKAAGPQCAAGRFTQKLI